MTREEPTTSGDAIALAHLLARNDIELALMKRGGGFAVVRRERLAAGLP